jgi:hypothetical protein
LIVADLEKLKALANEAIADQCWEPLLGLTGAETEFAKAASPDAVLELIAELERLREKAEKFGHVERAMEALRCDEREGGIVTAASLVLISTAHNLNAARGVIDQECVTFDDKSIGDWRVTIERIKEVAHD